jgi:hypothetical protein
MNVTSVSQFAWQVLANHTNPPPQVRLSAGAGFVDDWEET